MKTTFTKILLRVFICTIFVVGLTGFSVSHAVTSAQKATSVSKPAFKAVTDMAGREVKIPAAISRVATVGSGPVMNGFLFALGQGDNLVNGIPARMDKPSWKYQYVLAPHIKNLPKVQSGEDVPSNEELTKLNPDVILTMDMTQLKTMENANLNVVYLSWTQPEDVKKAITLLGQIFGQQKRAGDYIRYFDTTLKRVKAITDKIPANKKCRVLYGSLSTLSNPHLISEWWLSTAGGLSATKEIHTSTENVNFDAERLLKWDPQVIILSTPDDLKVAYSDARFADVSAIKNKRVYLIPKGAHTWGNRNIEQPLTVLWTGSKLYPEAFKTIDINAEIKTFYKKIFTYDLNDQQVEEILSGDIKSF